MRVHFSFHPVVESSLIPFSCVEEVHPFIYDALLSLVLVHAEVSAIAKPLVARTLCSLVEELAKESLDAFSKVERFGMGGMLQASFS